MSRPIVLSNGEMHVGLNNYGLVHDLYYPYVGLSNHAEGRQTRHKIGVWVDGKTHWLDDGNWELTFSYPSQALIGHIIAKNPTIGVILELDSLVDAHSNTFLRNIHVVNLLEREREIRLFMHQAFIIDAAYGNTDTAQYLPSNKSILHYRGNTYFLISGEYNDKPFDQHSIGLFGIEGHEGTWRDADDGELGGANVEHGRVDSVIRFTLHIGAQSSEIVNYWIAAGGSLREVISMDKQIREVGYSGRVNTTAEWWRKWLQPAIKSAAKIDPKYQDIFIRSVMVIKSQIDKRGAVIASTDSSMLNYDRDAYAYCWPRDGANVLWPLIRMGYTEEPYRFFEFCKRVLHPGGYINHKFMADGGLGSSWHSYVHEDGVIAPPIQEDETALVLFVLAQFYETTKDEKILREFYDSMVVPMADWMVEFVDEHTGLPKASYDLWEEVFLTTTYTVSVVYGALRAAADLADAKLDHDNAVRWRSFAEDIKANAAKHLYNPERKSLYKGIRSHEGEIYKDDTLDASSIYGAFMFGLFDVKSPEMQQAAKTYHEVLRVDPNIEAYPRYEHDNYRRTDTSELGNWWFITTLWAAQYYTEVDENEKAEPIIDWVVSHALKTGMLSEQINPGTLEIISPAPLTWSHAELVSTLLDRIQSDDEPAKPWEPIKIKRKDNKK